MPIYEYRCEACERVTSVFVRSARTDVDAQCEHCGGKAMKRLMSRVGRVKSTQDVLDEYGTPESGADYRDPRQIGSWVEKRFEEYGMDVPDGAREMIDKAREGEMPDSLGL
ncbi:MAG: zinc ribbon domain-containing protein [Dehalococcoidia bacterium]